MSIHEAFRIIDYISRLTDSDMSVHDLEQMNTQLHAEVSNIIILERDARLIMAAAARNMQNNPYMPKTTTKILSQKNLKQPCPSECAICTETPTFNNATHTACNHYYCTSCWNDWMNSPNSNKRCPICRTNAPNNIVYKARAASKNTTHTNNNPQTVNEIIEINDVVADAVEVIEIN
jgi:hypothetical protein